MVDGNNNTRRVSEEFVIKIFDKIRDVNEEIATDVKDLRNAIIVLAEAFSKQYEGQPSPKELHHLLNSWGKTFEIRHKATSDKLDTCATRSEQIYTLLQEHCTHSDAGICSIEEELKEDEGVLNKILEAVKSVKNRTNVMIAVVAVAFTIITVAYFFVSASIDNVIETKMEKVEKHYQQDLQEQLDEISKAIRQHMDETK